MENRDVLTKSTLSKLITELVEDEFIKKPMEEGVEVELGAIFGAFVKKNA